MGALCPLCGARTSWMVFPSRPDLNQKIPMDCHACRKEEAVHWQQWADGIDVTQFGGGQMNDGKLARGSRR